MKAHRKALVALVAVLAGVCAVHAAPAKKPASVKWPGGQVSADGQIGFKTRGGKVLLNFAKNARDGAGPGAPIELHHADQATAEVDQVAARHHEGDRERAHHHLSQERRSSGEDHGPVQPGDDP